MIRSRNILATAALSALGMTLTVLVAIPSDGSARSVDYGEADIATERIGTAFSFAGEAGLESLTQADLQPARKGDRGVVPASPAAPAVTIGYQAGESTTVLVRLPAPRVASR